MIYYCCAIVSSEEGEAQVEGPFRHPYIHTSRPGSTFCSYYFQIHFEFLELNFPLQTPHDPQAGDGDKDDHGGDDDGSDADYASYGTSADDSDDHPVKEDFFKDEV
ncbi:hypothetical protein CDL15_Pgr017745 [Punica granatum]|uniref:Uncharacterized protein n=1 Tax=Punica granatum TaxID=22663 RepID=A0A218WIM0_PUNGR|nr:hypothetical protein CDL15_Pgr017745 [Punica granatum]